MKSFPILDLKGSPGQIGLEHGRQLAAQIEFARQFYLDLILAYTGQDEQTIFARAKGMLPLLEKYCPHLVEEMEGLAQGAKQDMAVVLMLNARTELMSDFEPTTGECTTFGLEGSRTVSGQTILAQNWDWRPEIAPSVALFRIRPAEGPDVLTLAEAGQLAKIGFNSQGLGVLLNILFCTQRGQGLPVHLLIRLILGCGSVNEALEMLKGLPFGAASNFLMGDEAKVVTTEISPGNITVIEAEKGLVFHTNHFRDPAMVEFDTGLALSPSSPLRLERLKTLLPGREKWDIPEMKEVLVDHEHKPLSICAHQVKALPPLRRSATVASLILDIKARRLHCAAGQPCQAEYGQIEL